MILRFSIQVKVHVENVKKAIQCVWARECVCVGVYSVFSALVIPWNRLEYGVLVEIFGEFDCVLWNFVLKEVCRKWRPLPVFKKSFFSLLQLLWGVRISDAPTENFLKNVYKQMSLRVIWSEWNQMGTSLLTDEFEVQKDGPKMSRFYSYDLEKLFNLLLLSK